MCVTSGLVTVPLQPRPATTGSVDVLPLQPRYLPTFDREFRSEPRDMPPKGQEDPNAPKPEQISLRYFPDLSPPKLTDTEIGLASVPAMAIGSSTEVLVSIVENQARLRKNSFLSACSREAREVEEEEVKSPDMENMKSPSTEFTTSTVHSTPVDEVGINLDPNDNEKVCDTNFCNDLNQYTV